MMLNVPSDFALRRSKSVLMFAIKVDLWSWMPFCANYVQTFEQKKALHFCKAFILLVVPPGLEPGTT